MKKFSSSMVYKDLRFHTLKIQLATAILYKGIFKAKIHISQGKLPSFDF